MAWPQKISADRMSSGIDCWLSVDDVRLGGHSRDLLKVAIFDLITEYDVHIDLHLPPGMDVYGQWKRLLESLILHHPSQTGIRPVCEGGGDRIAESLHQVRGRVCGGVLGRHDCPRDLGVVEWRSGGVAEWRSGGVVEWWSGGVVERWSGGWWSGGAVERWSGGVVERWVTGMKSCWTIL